MSEGEGGALRSLLALFKIQVESGEIDKADKKIEGFVDTLKTAAVTIGEAFAGREVFEFFKGQIEGAAHVQDLADRLGLGATAIKDFGFAAKASGIDLGSAAHALGTLNRHIGAALAGGQGAKGFEDLGVAVKDAEGKARPMQEIVEDLAEGLSKLPGQAERAAAAQAVFGREGRVLLPVLSKGKEGMKELFAESQRLGNGLGNEFYENSKKAREEWEHFDYAMQSLKDQIAAKAIPAFMRLGHWLTEAVHSVVELNKHTGLLNSALLLAGGAGVIRLIGTFERLGAVATPVIERLIVKMTALELRQVAAAGAAGLLLLAIADLSSDDSVLQGFVDRLLEVITGTKQGAHEVNGIREAFSALVDIIENSVLLVVNSFVEGLELAWDITKGIAKTMADIALGNWKDVGADIKNAISEIGSDVKKRTERQVSIGHDLKDDLYMSAAGRERRDAIRSGTYRAPSENKAEASKKPPNAYEIIAQMRAAPIPGFEHGGIGQPIKQDVNIKFGDISVKTDSDDPDGVARGTQRGLERGGRGIAQKINDNTLHSVRHP